jgi:para-aminobenzoate synthetase
VDSKLSLDLPICLEIIAWAGKHGDEDFIIMGLKHKERPIWAVQFHPESICTEHGETMISNFCEIVKSTMKNDRVQQSCIALEKNINFSVMPIPLVSPQKLKTKNLKAYIQSTRDFVDPEKLFLSLFESSPYSFWLDSAKVENGLSRFSFMGGGEQFGPER